MKKTNWKVNLGMFLCATIIGFPCGFVLMIYGMWELYVDEVNSHNKPQQK